MVVGGLTVSDGEVRLIWVDSRDPDRTRHLFPFSCRNTSVFPVAVTFPVTRGVVDLKSKKDIITQGQKVNVTV